MVKTFDATDINYFRDGKAFAAWLVKHHADRSELWVGFHKVGSGKPSLTWPQSVDEALCYGWIDGIRKRIDDTRYCIRFTPRKGGSTWSSVNIARVAALTDEGRMQSAGEHAFEARSAANSGIYAYEVRRDGLDEPYASLLKKQSRANAFFEAQPAGYRRNVCHWVMSAKRADTRDKRFAELVARSRAGETVPQFTRAAAATAAPLAHKPVDKPGRKSV
jgi:uncharacterized protein YdeI (YjbR/CyaY-like superfamily)